jgi:hypothetical protein
MRVLFAIGVLSFGLGFAVVPAQARYEGPWCANINFGYGEIESDCRYNSVEQCRQNVIAGNRGVCGLNPRWVGPDVAVRRHRKKAALTR